MMLERLTVNDCERDVDSFKEKSSLIAFRGIGQMKSLESCIREPWQFMNYAELKFVEQSDVSERLLSS